MRLGLDPPRRLALLLWALLGLFVLRVTGQVLVAFFGVGFLPPMQQWYSGLLPYEYLLPSQIGIVVVMAKICVDFTRGTGFFVMPRRFFAVQWLYFGYLYLAGDGRALSHPDGPSSRVALVWRHYPHLLSRGAGRFRHRRRSAP
jgi:hypothetical protein